LVVVVAAVRAAAAREVGMAVRAVREAVRVEAAAAVWVVVVRVAAA